MIAVLLLMLGGLQTAESSDEVGAFTKALWFMQLHARSGACTAQNDRLLKDHISNALAGDNQLSLAELGDLIEPTSWGQLAGEDGLLSIAEIDALLQKEQPRSRAKLTPELRRHLDLLTTSFDMIDQDHHRALDGISTWIATNYREDLPLNFVAVCTGNSRRSMMTAMMGNAAASYYGFENVRFYSGGTKPSAFNQRAIRTLKEVGFLVEPAGTEAPQAELGTPNPIYRVAWGKELQTTEFSKMYNDASNPQRDFAGLLVCSEAEKCPMVIGASNRFSLNFVDPKLYDNSRFERQKYDERRDAIGRALMCAFANARCKITERKSTNP